MMGRHKQSVKSEAEKHVETHNFFSASANNRSNFTRQNSLVITMTAALISSFLLTGCSEKIPETDARTVSPLVRIADVKNALPQARSYTGTVAARVQSDLGFRVSGKVLERLVDQGQAVKRGQTLMRIDPIDLKLSAKASSEDVSAAQARANQAIEDEKRYRNLLGTGAISSSTYAQFKAAADSAKAELSAAKAQAEVAKNATQYTELLADADGIVVDTFAEPGQVVNAGQVVVRLAHDGQREAVIQLPESLRPEIGSTAIAAVYGQKDVKTQSHLRQLSDAADQITRTFEARYVLTGDLAKTPLGSTVTIEIPRQIASATQLYQVPIGALLDEGKGPGIWIIENNPTHVTWRAVSVDSLTDDVANISGPINTGNQVIAIGAHLLHEGQEVRLPQTDEAQLAGAEK